jgi:hypothetical protein
MDDPNNIYELIAKLGLNNISRIRRPKGVGVSRSDPVGGFRHRK